MLEELAIDEAGTELLDFGDVLLGQGVDPVDELAAGHFDCIVGSAGDFVYHFSRVSIFIGLSFDFDLIFE